MNDPATPEKKLPRAVVALGWVSFFTDAASDMIYPLLPAFLLSLGGGAVALGWIEGVAESVSAIVKVSAGRASDRARRKKPIVALGYAISALSRPLFAIATAPLHAVLVRSVDRVGKGLRGPPRDAIVAGSVDAARRGHAFGFQRMMDNLGAVLGPIVAFLLLRLLGVPIRTVFALALIPGLVAVAVIFAFVREPAPASSPQTMAPAPAELGPGARRYLCALAIFALASSADIFLLRRLTDLGLDVALVPIAWLTLQLGKALTNVPGGRASDRLGRRDVLRAAWVVYAATYAALACTTSWVVTWVLLAGYSFYYGLAEGGQRALLAELAPAEARGRAFGWQLAIEGAMSLPANLLFGLVYDRVGPRAALAGTGAIALVAVLALSWLVPRRGSRL